MATRLRESARGDRKTYATHDLLLKFALMSDV